MAVPVAAGEAGGAVGLAILPGRAGAGADGMARNGMTTACPAGLPGLRTTRRAYEGRHERCTVSDSQLARRALHASVFTVVYNVLEGVVSMLLGGAAGSAALIGFGLDSFV